MYQPILICMSNIASSIDPKSNHLASDQRRAETRHSCDREISIMPLTDDADRFVSARLTDCSMHGLGMTASHLLQPGQQFVVRLKLDRMILLMYTLRYCIPTKRDEFRIGAKFTGYHASPFQDDLQRVVNTLTGQH